MLKKIMKKKLYDMNNEVTKDLIEFLGLTKDDVEGYKIPRIVLKKRWCSCGTYNPISHVIYLKTECAQSEDVRDILIAESAHALYRYCNYKGIRKFGYAFNFHATSDEIIDLASVIHIGNVDVNEYNDKCHTHLRPKIDRKYDGIFKSYFELVQHHFSMMTLEQKRTIFKKSLKELYGLSNNLLELNKYGGPAEI